MSSTSRRQAIATMTAAVSALIGAGCAPPTAPPSATPSPSKATNPTGVTPVLANSELVVGPNRFAIGLIGDGNRSITDARVTFGFFKVDGDQAVKRAEVYAELRSVEQEARGVYAARVEFDLPGSWGVEVRSTRAGQPAAVSRVNLQVLERGFAPMIGMPAPRSKTPTLADVIDPSTICSNAPPCVLHGVSVDSALTGGRPTVVLFASPGFCTSAICAPELAAVLALHERVGSRAPVVHVEIYKDP